MKQTFLRTLIVVGVVCTTTTVLHSQQVPLPTTAAQVSGPAPGTAMTKPYVQMVARMAYFWGWPLVNAANRAVAFSKAPQPGLLGGVVPVAYNHLAMLTGYIAADQHFIACPNQDVAYGAGFFDLDKERAVIRCRTSAIAFGSLRSTTGGRMNSPRSESNTVPNRVFI